MARVFKQVIVGIVVVLTLAVFALFAFNYYRRSVGADDPAAKPPVIFERSDRPSRA